MRIALFATCLLIARVSFSQISIEADVLAPINRAFFCNNLLFLISDKLPMVILEPKVK